MKKIIAACCILITFTFQLHAQENRFYFTAGMSKDFAAGKQAIAFFENKGILENVVSTFGKGFSFGPTVGYMFSENIGAEIGYSFFNTSDIEINVGDGFSRSITMIDASMRRIIPAIKLTTGNKLKPFAKFGVVFGINPVIEVDHRATMPGISYKETNEYTNGSTIGLMSSMGAEWKLSRVTGLYLEFKLINQTWAPEVMHYHAMASGNGGSVTETGSLFYLDSLSGLSTTQRLKNYYSFSSLGINLGIKFNLGRKSIDGAGS